MALIKCVECGKEISDKAKACIHCGYPLEKEERKSKKDYYTKLLEQKVYENSLKQEVLDDSQTNIKKYERVIIKEKDFEKYSFILKEKHPVNGTYSVNYEPIFLYTMNGYCYGIFTNYKFDNYGEYNQEISLCNYKFPSNHSQTFSVDKNIENEELNFLNEKKDSIEFKKIYDKYNKLALALNKDYHNITDLIEKVFSNSSDEELIENTIKQYEKIRKRFIELSIQEGNILNNWSLNSETFISKIDEHIETLNNLLKRQSSNIFKKISSYSSSTDGITNGVLSGAFRGCQIVASSYSVQHDQYLYISGHPNYILKPEYIRSYKVLNESHKSNTGNVVTNGMVGSLFLGPIGFLGGALLTDGKKSEVKIFINWMDHNSSVILLKENSYIRKFIKDNSNNKTHS